jgi:hypothetical protein
MSLSWRLSHTGPISRFAERIMKTQSRGGRGMVRILVNESEASDPGRRSYNNAIFKGKEKP